MASPPPHPCPSRSDRLYCQRTPPSEEKQVGHSEGIMCPLMLALGATRLVGVPALIALGPGLLLAQVQPQELKHWVTATGLDFAPLLFGLAAILLIGAALGVVFATRAQRRRERRSEESRIAPANAREVALALGSRKVGSSSTSGSNGSNASTSSKAISPRRPRRSVSSAVGLTGYALRTSTSAKKVRLSCAFLRFHSGCFRKSLPPSSSTSNTM
jgi:hypothetical protein